MKRKFSEKARRVEKEKDPEKIVNDITDANEVAEKLRGGWEHSEALLDHGWHEENCGISVKSKRRWKEEREDVVDKHTFDFLLFDIIEAELVFWKHHYHYKDDEKFIEDVIESEENSSGNNYHFSSSAVNVVETFLWLRDEIQAPREHKSRQQTLDSVK